ncbi:hypothetical protein RhiJN_06639 [Ceratobasidium sp. AG-Ba]|nr:hypothetical protein RhiJN_06639 [Ceratobasidium sp. AG-Ba]QRW07551.1 hypothetical protein RhiLY_06550 [Ceratobasidium sp. AG-Ba]
MAGLSEGDVLDYVHSQSLIPGIARAISHGYARDEQGNQISRIGPRGNIQNRYRIVFADYGEPLATCTSVYQFLRVIHDALSAQMNLWDCRAVIHRNICDDTIRMSVAASQGHQAQTQYESQDLVAPYIKELLDESVSSDDPNKIAECLITDFEECVILVKEDMYEDARTRTGVPGFMARSVAQTKLLTSRRPMIFPAMPQLPNTSTFEKYKAWNGFQGAGRYDRFYPATQRMFAEYISGTYQSTQFRHHPFHDAESTLWVISRWLVHAIPLNSQDIRSDSEAYKRICVAMYETSDETRPLFPAISDWRKFLHPGLSPELAVMLGEMHRYLQPEWALLRNELRPDHAQEALRRLVFKEIIRMKETGDFSPVSGHKRPIHVGVVPRAGSQGFLGSNYLMPDELMHAIKELGLDVTSDAL